MAKTVLVTGASHGIGRAVAILFAECGYQVAANYCQSHSAAIDLAEKINNAGGICRIYQFDVSDRGAVTETLSAINYDFGEIDVLVNNAGISQQKLFTELTEAEWRRMFEINVNGVFNCTQAVVPRMISEKQGRIINISSIWGITGASCEVHYSASKAAVIGFTKALAKELGPSGITVNCIAPGVIETAMNADLDASATEAIRLETPLMRLGRPKEIAHAVLFLAGEAAGFITGQVLSPNGGLVV